MSRCASSPRGRLGSDATPASGGSGEGELLVLVLRAALGLAHEGGGVVR
jgi:hypothetical protein